MSIRPADFECLSKSGEAWLPNRVLLFSGHMIDSPNRTSPRFPADKEPLAAVLIAKTLDELQAGPNDLALTQGACGGDILFAESCLQRGVKLQLLQPFEEAVFIAESVISCGADWLARYQAITAKLPSPPLAAPAELGPLAPNMDPYERCNLWLLATALTYGEHNLTFICLWDGAGGDGPGGTAHMVDEIKNKHGQVIWLNTRKLN